jgi:NADPH:quinone reductase-like Zn-dependent oxidoreductase
MKAIVNERYGSPDVLQLKEIEKHIPKDNEVLVKVHAASVNALDWHYLRATPFPMRFVSGLFKPKNNILGADVAGVIESAGKNVTKFKPGDEVFGDMYPLGLGAFAEYVIFPENGVLTLKPPNVTFEEAAAVPAAAVTALQGIRDKGKIQSGQKVLINGAAGSVGTFSVQIAKSYGTEVTGICSTKNLEMVHSIGADFVIDYTKEDFAQNGQQYDLIIDNVGNRSVSDLKRAMTPNGTCVIIGYSSPALLLQHSIIGPLSQKTGKKLGMMGEAKANIKDLNFLKELLETGKIKPVIDRRYLLSETADAIRYVETGHARAKVIINVELNNKN